MEKELVIFHSFVTADHDPDQNHVGAEVDGKLASEKESVDGQNLKD